MVKKIKDEIVGSDGTQKSLTKITPITAVPAINVPFVTIAMETVATETGIHCKLEGQSQGSTLITSTILLLL